MKLKKISPVTLSLIIVSAIIVIQFIYAFTSNRFHLAFGVEYGNIAMSMLSGEGFGNPFYPTRTGLTAWMPPFLVYLIYVSFAVFGKYSLGAFIFLSILKIATYGLTFYYLCKILQHTNIPIYPMFLGIIFLVYFMFSPSDNLSNIHDFWVIQLLIVLFIYATLKVKQGSFNYLILLGVVLFIAPFNNPGFSIAFMVAAALHLYLLPAYKTIRQKRNLKIRDLFNRDLVKMLFITILFLSSVTIWSIRNYNAFGRFMPTKSNMWFEFYLSNIVDTDGQLSQSTTYRAHPIYNQKMRNEILLEGEAEWLANFEAQSKEFLLSNTSQYFRNVATRMFNAFIFIENDNDKIYSSRHEQMKASDKRKLETQKWMVKDYWLVLYYSQDEFKKMLKDAEIENLDLVIEDWTEAKQSYIKKKYSTQNVFRSIFMALIPTLSIFLLLITRRYRKNPAVFLSITLYFVYLLPYLLLSHQIRYQRPLFILQVFLVYVTFTWFVDKIPEKYTRFLKTN